MNVRGRVAILAALFHVAPVFAGDLQKLDRRIAKEPVYSAKTQEYCLLVFGPEAKTRIWLVIDGDDLYVDRNSNGDLTEPKEKVRLEAFRQEPEGGTTAQMRDIEAGHVFDGKLKHEHLRLRQQRLSKNIVPTEFWEQELKTLGGQQLGATIFDVSVTLENRPRPGDPIRIAGHIDQHAGMDGAGFLQFAGNAKDAPVIHFRGPLQMGLWGPQRLTLGAEPSELRTVVGTPGVGRGTFASLSYTGLIVDDAKPAVEIEFPSLTPGSLLKVQCPLPYRC